jgi:peptide/nickel transport system ATP-binding protein
MPGSQPQPGNIGSGCSFYDRCNFSSDECKVKVPELEYLSEIDTSVRCFNHSELMSKTSEQKITNELKNEITIDEILDLKDVSISYAKQGIIDQFLNKVTDTNPTVKDINININKGETIALVGESGSGKSTILKSIAGLLKTKDGHIKFDKEKLLSGDLKKRNSEDLRSIQLIFQNPDESLNPNHTVEQILSQP